MAVCEGTIALAAAIRRKVFAVAPHIDVLVTADPDHVGYLTGYRTSLLDVDRDYLTAAVASRDDVRLVTGASDSAPALEFLPDPATIHRYGTFHFAGNHRPAPADAMPVATADFAAALLAAVAASLRHGHVLGIDVPDKCTADLLRDRFSDHRTIDGRPALLDARSTKLPEEVIRLEAAARCAEAGLERALHVVRPGMTERALAAVISHCMIDAGAVPRFLVVTSGERSARVDTYATAKIVEPGEIVRFDIGCTLDGYWADIARTAVVGEPTALQRDRYAALLSGQSAQLDLAKPGVSAADLFHAAVRTVRGTGLADYQRHHCGHGIGVAAHEPPTIALHEATALAEGMVLCVETPIYLPDWGGMMVEDMLGITADGHRRLTRSDRHLRIL